MVNKICISTCLLLLSGIFGNCQKHMGSYSIVSLDPDTTISINTPLNYSHIQVHGLQFKGVYFSSKVSLDHSEFSGFTELNNVEFKQDVNFENDYFKGKITLNSIEFHGEANFSDVKFPGYVSFSDLVFDRGATMNLNRAKLPDILIFDYSSRLPLVDFTEADFSDSTEDRKWDSIIIHKISLYKSDISKMRLDYIHFKLIWKNHAGTQMNVEDKETVYEALLKNFKDNGQSESYKRLDIEYQDFKWRKDSLGVFSCISKKWWNYGYNKEYIFLWTGFFVLLFSITTFFMLGYLNENVYKIKNIPDIPRLENIYKDPPFYNHVISPTHMFRNILVRLWYSFVYASTIFFRLTLKIEDIQFNKFWGPVYIIMVYTIGLICLAYMANFVLQK